MHPFRDKPLQCPRCGKPLAHYPGRDKWRCKQCNGVLVAGDQLVVEIGPHSGPVLEGEADPARSAIHPCPACAFPMTPYTIPGTPPVEVDRCVTDRLVWFDGGEIGKTRATIPVEDDTPLFNDAIGFIAKLRAEEAALRAGKYDEIPLEDWPPPPMTSGEWKARTPCSDGACNGILENGICNVCGMGKPAS